MTENLNLILMTLGLTIDDLDLSDDLYNYANLVKSNQASCRCNLAVPSSNP